MTAGWCTLEKENLLNMLTGYVCRGPNADNARDKKETFSGAIRLGATLKISCETMWQLFGLDIKHLLYYLGSEPRQKCDMYVLTCIIIQNIVFIY